jgi:hypothetical protein
MTSYKSGDIVLIEFPHTKTEGSGLAITHSIAGTFLNSIDPQANSSRIFRLKPSRNSAGDNVSPPKVKVFITMDCEIKMKIGRRDG